MQEPHDLLGLSHCEFETETQLELVDEMMKFGAIDPGLVLEKQQKAVAFREQEFGWLKETLGELLG